VLSSTLVDLILITYLRAPSNQSKCTLILKHCVSAGISLHSNTSALAALTVFNSDNQTCVEKQTLSARSSASPIHLKRKEIVDDLKALRCSAATSLAACNLRSKVLVPTAARDDHVTDSSSTSSPYLASRGPPSDGSSDPFSLGSDLGGVISYTISSPSFPQPLLAPVASSLADLGIDATLCSTAACILSSLSVSPITLDGGHAHDSEDLEGEEKRTAEARDGWKTRRRSGLGRREIRIPKRFREEGDYSRCFKRRRHE
jgi:hypothetical protein